MAHPARDSCLARASYAHPSWVRRIGGSAARVTIEVRTSIRGAVGYGGLEDVVVPIAEPVPDDDVVLPVGLVGLFLLFWIFL